MSIAWIHPAALWGLALIALPIAIHLLVRQQTRSVAYPSLRFVRETALAAFRRRAIQDALLLACRAAIVAASVVALAGPILQTPSRTASHAARVSRAVVQLDEAAVAREREGAFRFQTFRRAQVADAIGDALRWLDAQPPSAREIVFTGALWRGQIAASDASLIPAGVGVRFARAAGPGGADRISTRILTRRDGRQVFAAESVVLGAASTQVTAGAITPAGGDRIRVVAAPKDQPLADAALMTVLDAGLRWPNGDHRLLVAWEGAAESSPADARVVRMPVPDPPATAATALWNAIDAAVPREAIEPLMIAPADLEAWSRAPGPPSSSALPADEGDRRWLWAAVLLLLALEYWLRRERQAATSAIEERRVA